MADSNGKKPRRRGKEVTKQDINHPNPKNYKFKSPHGKALPVLSEEDLGDLPGFVRERHPHHRRAAILRAQGVKWAAIAEELELSENYIVQLYQRPWWHDLMDWATRIVVRMEASLLGPAAARSMMRVLEADPLMVPDPSLVVAAWDRAGRWSNYLPEAVTIPGAQPVQQAAAANTFNLNIGILTELGKLSKEQLDAFIVSQIAAIGNGANGPGPDAAQGEIPSGNGASGADTKTED